jgi:hypothetical protein
MFMQGDWTQHSTWLRRFVGILSLELPNGLRFLRVEIFHVIIFVFFICHTTLRMKIQRVKIWETSS